MPELIEIRTYQLKCGTAAQFHALLHTQSLPFLRAAGTDVVAAQASLHDPNAYVLIRAYASLAERLKTQAEFYGSAAWLNGPRAAVMDCIDSYHTVVLAAEPSLIAGLRRPVHAHSSPQR